MLIDYIPAEKLPWILVWIDWNFYAYLPSFIVIELLAITHFSIHTGLITIGIINDDSLSLVLFIGFCGWCVYCAIRYGYAVG